MATKKKVTEKFLVSTYMNHVLQHNEAPRTVFNFAKENNFDEHSFYEHFGSFEALEQKIFTSFFEQTHQLLEKNKDYQDFDARNQLLSFHYTFFELLTANRSYVVYVLDAKKSMLKSVKSLRGLRKVFMAYVESLDIETLDIKNKELERFQSKTLQEGAWLQLLLTLKFWLDDDSASFEKTDIFIEKSVNTSFDLILTQPLKSVMDLGKFLYKEKMHMN
nr:TetR family transcriptional regulator C-terminal domain-containing protein [Allomuricauda sp.]